jgi:hypothetical protein
MGLFIRQQAGGAICQRASGEASKYRLNLSGLRRQILGRAGKDSDVAVPVATYLRL